MGKFYAPWMLTRQAGITQAKFGKQLRDWDLAKG